MCLVCKTERGYYLHPPKTNCGADGNNRGEGGESRDGGVGQEVKEKYFFRKLVIIGEKRKYRDTRAAQSHLLIDNCAACIIVADQFRPDLSSSSVPDTEMRPLLY